MQVNLNTSFLTEGKSMSISERYMSYHIKFGQIAEKKITLKSAKKG